MMIVCHGFSCCTTSRHSYYCNGCLFLFLQNTKVHMITTNIAGYPYLIQLECNAVSTLSDLKSLTYLKSSSYILYEETVDLNQTSYSTQITDTSGFDCL